MQIKKRKLEVSTNLTGSRPIKESAEELGEQSVPATEKTEPKMFKGIDFAVKANLKGAKKTGESKVPSTEDANDGKFQTADIPETEYKKRIKNRIK